MKILASDFDNTIYYLDDDKKNSKNAEAIRKFHSNGNLFCIVTGRNYTTIKELLSKNNIPYDYLICEDGAIIFNKEDKCLSVTRLSTEQIENTKEILDNLGCNYYLDDGVKETTNSKETVKIVVKCENEEEKTQIVKKIKEQIDVHIYASRFHVNIINKIVNKKYGIDKLFALENLSYEDLFVIGDNDNDYEMLKYFTGAVITEHHEKLDTLNKPTYDTISDYVEELMKDK